MATGLVVALSYLFSFVSVKTFLSLEQFLSIGGTFVFYGSVAVLGLFNFNIKMYNIFCNVLVFTIRFCYMFVFMPETENRTLEEVERYYSDTNRRATDRRIMRILLNTKSETNEAFSRSEVALESKWIYVIGCIL